MRFARDREKNVFLSEGSEREPTATAENFRSQLDESLRRLRTDVIDVLYIHSCYSPAMATFEPLMNALVRAKESGKARFIGVSTHKNVPEVIRAAADTGNLCSRCTAACRNGIAVRDRIERLMARGFSGALNA
jgi:aryl-alcohol dehydrogenase-like predicted oxidoreductase